MSQGIMDEENSWVNVKEGIFESLDHFSSDKTSCLFSRIWLPMVDQNLRDKEGNTPLLLALKAGAASASLLLAWPDVDPSGRCPLHHAATENRLEAVRFLLLKGADLDAKNSCGEHARDLGARVFREGGDIVGNFLPQLFPDHPDRRFLREAAGKSLWKTLESLAEPHFPSLSPNLK